MSYSAHFQPKVSLGKVALIELEFLRQWKLGFPHQMHGAPMAASRGGYHNAEIRWYVREGGHQKKHQKRVSRLRGYDISLTVIWGRICDFNWIRRHLPSGGCWRSLWVWARVERRGGRISPVPSPAEWHLRHSRLLAKLRKLLWGDIPSNNVLLEAVLFIISYI